MTLTSDSVISLLVFLTSHLASICLYYYLFSHFIFFFFFFSSRRRHTRCSRDWSSDVCSSDLKIRGMLIDSWGDASWVTDSAVLGSTAGAGRDLDATLKAYLAMANSREPELLAPRLPQIRCPVRLLVGGARHDGDVGSKEVDLLAHTLPAFALDSVPAAGHFIQEEEPGAVLAGVARLKASVTAAHATGSQ